MNGIEAASSASSLLDFLSSLLLKKTRSNIPKRFLTGIVSEMRRKCLTCRASVLPETRAVKNLRRSRELERDVFAMSMTNVSNTKGVTSLHRWVHVERRALRSVLQDSWRMRSNNSAGKESKMPVGAWDLRRSRMCILLRDSHCG